MVNISNAELLKCEYCKNALIDDSFVSCINCHVSLHGECFYIEAGSRNYCKCMKCKRVGTLVTSSVDFLQDLINSRKK